MQVLWREFRKKTVTRISRFEVETTEEVSTLINRAKKIRGWKLNVEDKEMVSTNGKLSYRVEFNGTNSTEATVKRIFRAIQKAQKQEE